MNTALFKPEPLFVIDNTSIANEGPLKGHLIGTFDIVNRPTLEDGRKWIGDTKPYGDGFPDLEEAKAYAKLFAAAPDLLDAAIYAMECIERLNTELGQIGDNGDQAYNTLKAAVDKALT